MFIHVVNPGESLFTIARAYGVSISSIMQVNELPSPNLLVPGMALVIPSDVVFHIVRPNESLWFIAQRYSIPIEELAAVNSIDSQAIVYPGEILRIPQRARPVIEVNGYIYMLGQQAAPIVRSVGI